MGAPEIQAFLTHLAASTEQTGVTTDRRKVGREA
jgi:hypothetical protein